jgi:hypothetical protein
MHGIAVRLPQRLALSLVLVVTLLGPTLGAQSAPSRVVLPSPEALDTLLTATLRPPRNLYTLTARLKLHSTTPIDPYVNTTPPDYRVGRVDKFYVASYSDVGYSLVPAVLMLKTAHAYFYVQQGLQVQMAGLQKAGADFEQHIYPTDHALFGDVWTPGIDDDQHITIFNGQLPAGYAGYYSGEDLYPRIINPYSNQRKMLYMQLGVAEPGTANYDSVLAHELQHMIHYHRHPADEAWINEGDSILAQVLNGYDASGFDNIKADDPDTQLDTWSINNDGPSYGGGYLWMLYLYEHFGGDRATQMELSDNSMSNMALFDDVLKKLGSPLTANDVFANWVVANYLNNPGIDGGIYGYARSNIRSMPTLTTTLPFTHTQTMHQYAANYIQVNNPGGHAFTLHFSGQPTVSLLHTVAPPQGFWWSNRGDVIDTTLDVPPLDLRTVTHATLHYQAWWMLEQDYDYGYVEVSTDGGNTWYAQRTAHTTNTNPNGANIGNGYTGSSCSGVSAAQNCWVNEQVDLSPYAGKQILVRFETVTDDEYNEDGMAITHLQVPEIGFDGDTTAGGWQPAGWVRSGNTLAEPWVVQAIESRPGAAPTVVRMPVTAGGTGSLTVPGSVSQVVVVVSPLAPLTTVTNGYTLSGGPGQ